MPKSLEEQVDDFKHIVSQLDFIDGQSLCMWAWRLNDECLSFGQCAAAALHAATTILACLAAPARNGAVNFRIVQLALALDLVLMVKHTIIMLLLPRLSAQVRNNCRSATADLC